jgi:hypothetical protein
LADVDLLTIVNMENNSFYVVINQIPTNWFPMEPSRVLLNL